MPQNTPVAALHCLTETLSLSDKHHRYGARTKLDDCVQPSDACKSLRKNLAYEQNERLSEFSQEGLRFKNYNAKLPQSMRLLSPFLQIAQLYKAAKRVAAVFRTPVQFHIN